MVGWFRYEHADAVPDDMRDRIPPWFFPPTSDKARRARVGATRDACPYTQTSLCGKSVSGKRWGVLFSVWSPCAIRVAISPCRWLPPLHSVCCYGCSSTMATEGGSSFVLMFSAVRTLHGRAPQAIHGVMRLLPHHQDTGGFFVALLRKVCRCSFLSQCVHTRAASTSAFAVIRRHRILVTFGAQPLCAMRSAHASSEAFARKTFRLPAFWHFHF